MTLSIVDVFASPYEVWSTREASVEEAIALMQNQGLSFGEASQIREALLKRISTHFAAAAHMLEVRVDNALEAHVDAELGRSAAVQALRALMPRATPAPLLAYQSKFPAVDMASVDAAINANGVTLPEGQMLFHGGAWPPSAPSHITTRPFSTSFCPQVALRNAEWGGKAYDAGRVELMVVRVTNPCTKAFVYGTRSSKAHEKEVVFASGARLIERGRHLVGELSASRVDANLRTVKNTVPAYVLHIDLS